MDANGWSARQVGRELSIDHTGVTRALSLLTFPAEVQEAVEVGQIAPRTGYELTKIVDPIEQATAAALAAAGHLKRDDLVKRNRKPQKSRGATKGKMKGKGRLPAEVKHRSQNGCRSVVHTWAGRTLADVLDALSEFADRIRTEIESSDRDAA